MQIFTAISNSTLYDVCLNCYGTLDYLTKLIIDNGILNINQYPYNGQQFSFDESLVANQSIQNLNIKYATI